MRLCDAPHKAYNRHSPEQLYFHKKHSILIKCHFRDIKTHEYVAQSANRCFLLKPNGFNVRKASTRIGIRLITINLVLIIQSGSIKVQIKK